MLKHASIGVAAFAVASTVAVAAQGETAYAEVIGSGVEAQSNTVYSAKFVVRDAEGNENVLQTATFDSAEALNDGGAQIANSFVGTYGNWSVEAAADSFTYVFTAKSADPESQEPETEAKEYTAKFVVRDAEGNKTVLETATFNDWDAAENGSVNIANSFKDEFGEWDVEATDDGFTYVFTAKSADPEGQEPETEAKEYTAKFVVRDAEGNETVLETATFDDWDAAENGSVNIANSFRDEFGEWDVEATDDGFTYVFTAKDASEDKAPYEGNTYKDGEVTDLARLAAQAQLDYLDSLENKAPYEGNAYKDGEVTDLARLAAQAQLNYLDSLENKAPYEGNAYKDGEVTDLAHLAAQAQLNYLGSLEDKAPYEGNDYKDGEVTDLAHLAAQAQLNYLDSLEDKAPVADHVGTGVVEAEENVDATVPGEAVTTEASATSSLPQTGVALAGLGLGLLMTGAGTAFAFKKRN
ncbi:MAG: hypothetical protein MR008_04330 [Aerococcus sp.]|nr:hypothetical protein [Aerococcus sp.]